MKQLLLHIVLKDGKIAPTGANILDEKGNYLTSIMGDGNILISNEQIGKQLILRSPNKNDCVIEYNVPEVFSSELIYEEEDAVCL
ncbi:FimD/PapC C-terminal domain-containing protein [Providencia manganoxydans]|uniref:FimD/PapC C-terminal domain-containing protein n=1 Tax=Providencia manganoxydans TaxID=2923283 RepID=UPI0032DAA1AF